jgi:hypothetical protein
MFNYIGMTIGLLMLAGSAVSMMIFNLSWWFLLLAVVGLIVFVYFDVKEG